MSRTIALLIGSWVMYCMQVDDYAGAVAILFVYIVTVALKPFSAEKKSSSSGKTTAQK